jgi:putative ABC transport system permease protein
MLDPWVILAIIVIGIVVLAFLSLPLFLLGLVGSESALGRWPFGLPARFSLMIVRSLRRNLVRVSLTYIAIFALVVVVTTVWSILRYMDDLMTEKANDIKVIVTEKWSASSQLPFAYASGLSAGAADPSRPDDVHPLDSMTWQIYVGTVDPAKKTRESMVFLIGLEPPKLLTMMDEVLREVSPGQRQYGLEEKQRRQLEAGVAAMLENKRAIIMGKNRLKTLDRRVGDRITLTGINYTGLDLEFEIMAELPESGRYDEIAFMNCAYLNDSLDSYARNHGSKHPRADKSLDLVWLKAANQWAYGKISGQIESSAQFHNPAVKCETLASAVATVMESYRDLIWGMRWLLSPAILVTMSLVVANAISLSVRERRTELAVLKVMGFRPGQVLLLVVGEAAAIGLASGFLSTSLCYVLVNHLLRTVNPMPMAVPTDALWWGPVLGAGTALTGSIVPAANACRVKVSEVFARVT